MAERAPTKTEIASQKKSVKLPPAIGDWTTYRPPKVLVKKVKTGLYGFDRLSKDEINQVLMIHYRFVQDLFKHFLIDLALSVEFYSCQVEQTTYLSFLRSLLGPVVQGKIIIPSIHEGVQVFFELDLANSIINHAVGSRDLEVINRKLTQAEEEIFTTTINHYLPAYANAFEKAIENPSFKLISNPDVTFDSALSTSSTFVSFSAEVSFNEGPSRKIIFGYLAGSLKKIITLHRETTKRKPLDFSKLPSSTLNRILIPATAFLGKTTLLTSELHQLEIGDVVSLDTLINSALPTSIGKQLKVFVQPGIKNKKRAVRIVSTGEEEIKVSPPIEVAEEPLQPEEQPPKEPPKISEEKPEEELFPEELPEEEFPEEELFPEEEEEFKEEEFLEEEFPEEEFPEETGPT